jgi:hypothetical protein
MAMFIFVACSAFIFGEYLDAAFRLLLRLIGRAIAIVARLLPSGPAGWGALSVVTAFVLLVAGAATSLRRGKRSDVPNESREGVV